MTQARDVDLAEWLNGIGFHPVNSERKQLGHEATRQLVGDIGQMLHSLLPPGRDKSLVFTHLEDALMRANRALALGGGPQDVLSTELLREQVQIGSAPLPKDDRIEQYKAEQRGETAQFDAGVEHVDSFTAQISGHRAVGEYDSTVATDDAEIKVDIHSSVASGRVQVGVLCTNPTRVEDVFTASGNDQGVTFDGFYAGFTHPDHLAAFLREVAAAGEAAFGPASNTSGH
jgi:hypothetical protein